MAGGARGRMRLRSSVEEVERLMLLSARKQSVGGRGLTAIETVAASRGLRNCMRLKTAAAHAGAHGLVKACAATLECFDDSRRGVCGCAEECFVVWQWPDETVVSVNVPVTVSSAAPDICISS